MAEFSLSSEAGKVRDFLDIIVNIIPSKSPIPLLQFVGLTTIDGKLTMHATNAEGYIKIKTDIESFGSAAVDARSLRQRLGTYRATDKFTLESDGKSATLKSGRSKFVMPVMPETDMPVMPNMQGISFTASVSDFINPMQRASIAAAGVKEPRFFLQGVNVSVDFSRGENPLGIVATDGHRLAAIFNKSPAEDEFNIIIPNEIIPVICRIFEKSGDVHVIINKNMIKIFSGQVEFSAKLVEGTFPDFNRVIPELSEISATTSTDDLNEVIRRVKTVDLIKAIGIKFEDCHISVISDSNSYEEFTDEIAAATSADSPYVGMQPDYVVDALRFYQADESLTIYIIDETQPVVFKSSRDNEIHIIMPVRLTKKQ